jgi:hypothetical protein
MALTPCSQCFLFAGRPLLFNTDSPKIAQYAADFLPQNDREEFGPSEDCATITIHIREGNEPSENAPWFRARGHFAFARFTRADSFWFNLRTREVYGVCTPDLAEDSWRWRAHIFPTLLGVLSAVIDVAPVHAACLVHDGRGTLLAGHSGAGKSTLVLSLARRGYALLSDEWTYLSADRSGVAAWGLPVPVKLLPDAIRFFPELRACRLARSLNGETAYEVFPDEYFGISRQMRCTVKTIVLLERAACAGSKIVPISATEAIDHLTSEVEPLEGPLARFYADQLAIIRSLEHAQCLRLSFNDHPSAVAKALDSVLAVMP